MKKNLLSRAYQISTTLFLIAILTTSCAIPAKLRPIKLQTDKATKIGVQFLKDEKTLSAVIRKLEIIGEAAKSKAMSYDKLKYNH